ncbi:MAG TPA: exodeoxyribonuclease VII small subunit, partial [Steroidobacteraceae bacterium]|nr:exodeoxyribonuclease VII small subunit [Steroidobacteraceae bacterium]
MSKKEPRTPDFEQALAELEAVVERLEHGELPLEQALTQFERGMAL